MITVAALGAVGVTTTLMTTQIAQATGAECHQNQGSQGCAGNVLGNGIICNNGKKVCHDNQH
ncbi:MAG TPA: hypothetical protein VH481_01710 [Nitrososphaeraceae archaeon]